MVDTKNIIKNTGFLYARMGITLFISLFTTRIILNSLGESDFGIFCVIGGAIALLGFLNSTMAAATQRFMSYVEGAGDCEKKKSIFNISLILHFCLSLLIGIILWGSAFFYFDGILNMPGNRIHAAHLVYYCLIVSTMFTVMTVPYEAVLNSHENMLYYAIIGVAESILKLLVAFAVMYTSGDKLVLYGILMTCIPLISLTVMRIYCHRHYKECSISPRRYFDRKLMKEMTSFAGWQFLISSTSMVTQYGQGIVLNHYWGVLLNTAQGIAGQLNGQLMAFSNTMLKALNPVIAKSEGAGQRETMLRTSFMGCKYSYLLMGCFCLPVIFEMKGVLNLWLGNIPDGAILFCRLQLICSLLGQLTISLGPALMAQGDIKYYTLLRSPIYLLTIAVTILGYHLGMPAYWLYISTILLSVLGGGGILLYFCKIKLGMNFFSYIRTSLIPSLLPTIPVIIMGYLLIHLPFEGMLWILSKCFILFTVFILCAYCWTLSVKEKQIFIQMLIFSSKKLFKINLR